MKLNTPYIENQLSLIEEKSLGKQSEIMTQNIDGIDYLIGEFWTSQQRQANRLHEISYRACFKPQLVKYFIDSYSQKGDIVYDPFMGRGTTPIEAALNQRIAYGNDINPLSLVLTKPRINPPSLLDIQKRLKSLSLNKKTIKNKELLVFYHPKTLKDIEALKEYFLNKSNNQLDNVDEWIRMVTINRLTGHSAGFLSVYTLPPNQAASIKSQVKINQRYNQSPLFKDLIQIILKKSQILLSQKHKFPTNTKSLLLTANAYQTPQIADNTVALTVTSPPFLDIVNYPSDNWLRCWFLNIDPYKINITMHSNVKKWQQFIQKTLLELKRITKPNGHIAFEVGEVKNNILLEKNVIKAALNVGLKIKTVFINQQKFTKTANCWGVTNNKKGTNTNRIVLMQKNKP